MCKQYSLKLHIMLTILQLCSIMLLKKRVHYKISSVTPAVSKLTVVLSETIQIHIIRTVWLKGLKKQSQIVTDLMLSLTFFCWACTKFDEHAHLHSVSGHAY